MVCMTMNVMMNGLVDNDAWSYNYRLGFVLCRS